REPGIARLVSPARRAFLTSRRPRSSLEGRVVARRAPPKSERRDQQEPGQERVTKDHRSTLEDKAPHGQRAGEHPRQTLGPDLSSRHYWSFTVIVAVAELESLSF